MNYLQIFPGAPASCRYKDFLFLFSYVAVQSRRGGEELSIQSSVFSLQGEVPGAPQDFAGNSRAARKEQASRLRSQVLDRQDAGAPREELCASAPLREIIFKEFNVRCVMPHRRAALPDFRFSQVLKKIKKSLLCVSASLRDKIFKVFSIQRVMPRIGSALPVLLYSQVLRRIKNNILCVSAPLREIKKPRIMPQSFRFTCNVLRNTLHDFLPLIPSPQNLVPLSKTEFVS